MDENQNTTLKNPPTLEASISLFSLICAPILNIYFGNYLIDCSIFQAYIDMGWYQVQSLVNVKDPMSVIIPFLIWGIMHKHKVIIGLSLLLLSGVFYYIFDGIKETNFLFNKYYDPTWDAFFKNYTYYLVVIIIISIAVQSIPYILNYYFSSNSKVGE